MLEELAKGESSLIYRKLRARFSGVYRAAVAYLVVMVGVGAEIGQRRAALVISGAALAIVLEPRLRARVVRWVKVVARRRRLELALLRALGERAPFVGPIVDRPVGEEVVARVVAGGDLAEVQKVAGKMAAALRCRSVRVLQDPEDASLAHLTIVRADPLKESVDGTEQFENKTFSIYERVPLGVDEDGATVGVPLFEHHFLIGGEPGAGKSVSLSVLLCAAALDPACDLWLMDGKEIELAVFKPVAKHFVGADIEAGTALLEELDAEMMARYGRLKERNEKKVRRNDGERLIVLAVDELAFFVADTDKQKSKAFAERLRKLVAMGRAAGIVVIAATQKPSADLVPTNLRDNFSYRLAHRCATRDASDTILGSGWASEGFSSSSIDSATRGVGYLLAEDAMPRRIRSYFLADADVGRIVRHGYELRRGNDD